jgi:hypothetical protein
MQTLPPDTPFPRSKRPRTSRYAVFLDGQQRRFELTGKGASVRSSLCRFARRHGMRARVNITDGVVTAQFYKREE